MLVELDCDDSAVMEDVMLAVVRRDKNVRLAVNEAGGRFFLTIHSAASEPDADGATSVPTPRA